MSSRIITFNNENAFNNKMNFIFLILFSIVHACSAQTLPIINSWKINDPGTKDSSNIKTVFFSLNNVYVKDVDNKLYNFPIHPRVDSLQKNESTNLKGLLLNGKKIFSNEKVNWNKLLSNCKKENKTPNIIGFALDGYPIYDSYPSNQKDNGEVCVIMHSSYQLKKIKKRIIIDHGIKKKIGPKVSRKFPLGFFESDYEYIRHSEENYADEHNGKFCKTLEYPLGTYCYFATLDSNISPSYPFFVGPNFYGEINDKVIDSIQEPIIEYKKRKIESKETAEKEYQLLVIFSAKSELIIIQCKGLNNEDISLQLLDSNNVLINETILNKGSTIAYFDAQKLYESTYKIKAITNQGVAFYQISIKRD